MRSVIRPDSEYHQESMRLPSKSGLTQAKKSAAVWHCVSKENWIVLPH